MQNQKQSFTLIELLVVIAIIGLLSTVVLISLSGVRAKARDARRLSDMKTLRTAIDMYVSDHNGNPFSTNNVPICLGIPSTETCWGGFKGNDALNAALAPYLDSIPKDPLYGARKYSTYIYRSPGSWWLPLSSGEGNYDIAFAPEKYPNNDDECFGYKWAAWDSYLPFHCGGGWCRQCGYLDK